MAHIVLMGDSIFDNAPYVEAGTQVQSRLQSMLGPEDQVSLLARDGSVLADMVGQVAALHALPEADWLVVSCGGNDVLGLVGAMQSGVSSVIEAAGLLADWQAEFRREYRRMVNVLLSRRKPVALATIYDGVPRSSRACARHWPRSTTSSCAKRRRTVCRCSTCVWYAITRTITRPCRRSNRPGRVAERLPPRSRSWCAGTIRRPGIRSCTVLPGQHRHNFHCGHLTGCRYGLQRLTWITFFKAVSPQPSGTGLPAYRTAISPE